MPLWERFRRGTITWPMIMEQRHLDATKRDMDALEFEQLYQLQITHCYGSAVKMRPCESEFSGKIVVHCFMCSQACRHLDEALLTREKDGADLSTTWAKDRDPICER